GISVLPCPATVLYSALLSRRPPTSPLFPYTTLFRSDVGRRRGRRKARFERHHDGGLGAAAARAGHADPCGIDLGQGTQHVHPGQDRKSTRLNSSHVKISYAVFCLKKKLPRFYKQHGI